MFNAVANARTLFLMMQEEAVTSLKDNAPIVYDLAKVDSGAMASVVIYPRQGNRDPVKVRMWIDGRQIRVSSRAEPDFVPPTEEDV